MSDEVTPRPVQSTHDLIAQAAAQQSEPVAEPAVAAVVEAPAVPVKYDYKFYTEDDQTPEGEIDPTFLTVDSSVMLAPGDLVNWDSDQHKVIEVRNEGLGVFTVIISEDPFDENAVLSDESQPGTQEEAPATAAPTPGNWSPRQVNGHGVEVMTNEDGTVSCRPTSHSGPTFTAPTEEAALAQVPRLA